ncbi:uncharacterized protein LOC142563076 isoform X2 [Dermacentor variabilis]
MENESWHAITEHIHVFSAFVGAHGKRTILVTSLVRTRHPKVKRTPIRHPPLVCVIRTSKKTIQRVAYIRIVWTFYNPSFRNALILCPSPNRESPADHYVQVAVAAQNGTANSLRWLHVHHIPKKSKEKCCAVCVGPLFSAPSLWNVVEFIVHYRVMGVGTFYFYDLNMTSDLKLLIARMQYLGVDLTAVPYRLIMDATVEHEHVHAHGQVPSLYDCMFRSLSKMEYTVNVDIDELIVPLPKFSIPAMVQQAERKMKPNLGSLVIPMRYHCLEYPLNLRYSSHELLPLQTRLFRYHSSELHHTGFTKYIARSRLVREVTVHWVKEYFGSATEALRDSFNAYIRHYRECCSYLPSDIHAMLGLFWNFTRVMPDFWFGKLSERIQSDPVMRALMSEMRIDRVTDSVFLNETEDTAGIMPTTEP